MFEEKNMIEIRMSLSIWLNSAIQCDLINLLHITPSRMLICVCMEVLCFNMTLRVVQSVMLQINVKQVLFKCLIILKITYFKSLYIE